MPHLHAGDFTSESARRIAEKLMEQWDLEGVVRIAALEFDESEEDLRRLVAELSIERHTVSKRWSELQNVHETDTGALLLENYRRILAAQLDERISRHRRRLKESADDAATDDLVRQYQELLAARQRCMQAVDFAQLDRLRHEDASSSPAEEEGQRNNEIQNGKGIA
jgi:hypothetical protein